MSINLSRLFSSLTSDVLTSIQIKHKAHNYIFNTDCEMLTASQSCPEATMSESFIKNPCYIMKVFSVVCIFFLKALLCAVIYIKSL